MCSFIAGEVTDDPSATVEFTQYNDLVRDYHVKLVGWNHPQWVNLSDLKGGIESLEKVASAIADGTCKFVSITREEVEEQMNHIKNGEKLTPELKPPMPPDTLPSASPPTTATPSSPSPLEPPMPPNTLSSTSPPTTATPSSPSSSPIESTRISSITDDLVDPALRLLASQPQPCAIASPLSHPANEDALVSTTNLNRKRPIDDTTPSKGQCPKRACKLTEKAQQLDSDSRETDKVQRRKAKGGQRPKKSRAVIDSDQENTVVE